MIGVLVGHCHTDPGNRSRTLSEAEYYYNNLVCDAVHEQFESRGFTDGIIINAVDSPDSDESIYDRIDMARAEGVSYAVEVHHNSVHPGDPNDYALCLHERGDIAGRILAHKIKDYLNSYMAQYNVNRWVVGIVPSQDWGRRAAIQDSPYSCVILESCFMNFEPCREYFIGTGPYGLGKLLANVLMEFNDERNKQR